LYTIIIIYTSQKNTFSGLQFGCRHYGSVFIHLVIVAFQNREIPIISVPHSISGSSKVIDLGVNRKLICDFLLDINNNLGPICSFEIFILKARKWLNFPIPPLRMSGWNLAAEK